MTFTSRHQVSISRRYTFSAAHQLDWHPGKCRALHGHGYVLEVEVAGLLDHRGVIMDFAEIDAPVQKYVLAKVDHTYLNEILENPTAELIALRIADWLDEATLPWRKLRLWETERASVTVRRQP